MRYFILIIVFLLCGGNLQAQLKFYAQADATEILENSYLDVEFILENADGENFRPPQFNNFKIVAGPNRSSSMSIINGKMNKKLSYGYTLRPTQQGRLTIGAATIETYAGTLSTETLTVKVLEASENRQTRSEDVFVETICSDSIVYVGQQLSLEYKLYTRLDVRSFNIETDLDYSGFYAEQLDTDREPTRREVLNGVEYATKVIKRVALFPQQRGSYTIEPAVVNLGIATDRNSRRFFFSTQLENRRYITNACRIEVRNPGKDAPESFSGAIGQYAMSSKLEKRTITTDDAIVVTMSVSGNGDNKTVLPPRWVESDSLEVYDPNIIKDSLYLRSGRRMHKKVFEYLIVPKYPGKYMLEPRFSYYDPDSMAYISLSDALPPVNVIRGTGASVITESEPPINTALMDHTTLEDLPDRIHGKPIHLLLILGLIMLCLGIIAYARYLDNSGKRDAAYIRKMKAAERARARLNALHELKSDKKAAFFEELTRSLKQYIQDKYNIPALHIGNDEIIKQLKHSANMNETQVSRMEVLLNDAEKALYAPGIVESTDKLYDRAFSLITELEA